MGTYDLIAIDMDGTALRSDKTISPRVLQALQAAKDAGKHVVISSGRGISELTVYRDLVQVARYAIAANGAVCYDFAQQRVLSQKLLEPAAVRMALEEALRHDTMLQPYLDGSPHVSPDDAQRMAHWNMGAYQEQFKTTTVKEDDIVAFIRTHEHELDKLIAYYVTPRERQQAHDALDARGIPADLVHSETASLEAMPLGANKGSGLTELCTKIGVPLSRTIAVGDSENDLEMLGCAGLPIAMGNALEKVRAICSVQVADNDHDGVVEAVEKYLLS